MNYLKTILGVLGLIGTIVAATAGYRTVANNAPFIENTIQTINDIISIVKLKPKCTTDDERNNDPTCSWAKKSIDQKDAP